jgi:hypothetical protein
MQVQSRQPHVARCASRVQGGQNQSQPAAVRWLNPGRTASLEKAFKAGMPEAHNHISLSFGLADGEHE